MQLRRRSLLLFAAIVTAAGLAGAQPASASAEGGANSAIAVNTTDGSTLVKTAFAIRHVMSDVVDQQNSAVAYASCTSCTTVAVAIEIVLVENNPSTVTPQNIAIAYNNLCSLCLTIADALQFVISTSGPVHFDDTGNKILESIRRELESLKHENLTLDELQAKIAEIRGEILDVLANHLVPAGKPEEQPRTTETESTPTTTALTTTTPTGSTTTATTPTTTGGATTTTTGP